MTHTLNPSDLRKFTGSENWYRHPLNRTILFTEGAKHIADAGGAYWLLDEIALAQRYQAKVAAEEFQAWTLTVDMTKHTATLTCGDGNGNAVFTKAIEYTDFPAESVTLWVENHTIFLPSER